MENVFEGMGDIFGGSKEPVEEERKVVIESANEIIKTLPEPIQLVVKERILQERLKVIESMKEINKIFEKFKIEIKKLRMNFDYKHPISKEDKLLIGLAIQETKKKILEEVKKIIEEHYPFKSNCSCYDGICAQQIKEEIEQLEGKK